MKALYVLFGLLLVINVASATDTELGKKLYQANCSQCHGMEGDGYGVNAADMDILPKDHTDTEEMISRTDKDLFKAIKFGGKSVNKSVLMPNWDANMNDNEINAVVAYLRVLCCSTGD